MNYYISVSKRKQLAVIATHFYRYFISVAFNNFIIVRRNETPITRSPNDELIGKYPIILFDSYLLVISQQCQSK